jgi:hypothetical protein
VACEILRQITPVKNEVNNLGTQVDTLPGQVVPAMQTQLDNVTTAVQNVQTTFDTLQGDATGVVTEMTGALDRCRLFFRSTSSRPRSFSRPLRERCCSRCTRHSSRFREWWPESERATSDAFCDQVFCENDPACQFLNAMNRMLCRVNGALQRILADAAISKRSELRVQNGLVPRSLLCATMFQTEGAADWISDVAVISATAAHLPRLLARREKVLSRWFRPNVPMRRHSARPTNTGT